MRKLGVLAVMLVVAACSALGRQAFQNPVVNLRDVRVRVDENGGSYEGVTAGLDSRGFLQLQTPKGTRTVLSGGVRRLDSE